MVTVLRTWIREYSNAVLFSLGLFLIAAVEGTSKAVFYTHVGIHYWKWQLPPLIVRVADYWWKVEHTKPYTAAAIFTCVAGAILMLVAYVRWLRSLIRRKVT